MSEILVTYLITHILASLLCYGCGLAYWQNNNEYQKSLRDEWYQGDIVFSSLIAFIPPFPINLAGCMLALFLCGYRPSKHGFKLY